MNTILRNNELYVKINSDSYIKPSDFTLEIYGKYKEYDSGNSTELEDITVEYDVYNTDFHKSSYKIYRLNDEDSRKILDIYTKDDMYYLQCVDKKIENGYNTSIYVPFKTDKIDCKLHLIMDSMHVEAADFLVQE